MDEVLILVSTQPFLHKLALQKYKMIHKKRSMGRSYLGFVG